jgi:putative transcriptional regulator
LLIPSRVVAVDGPAENGGRLLAGPYGLAVVELPRLVEASTGESRSRLGFEVVARGDAYKVFGHDSEYAEDLTFRLAACSLVDYMNLVDYARKLKGWRQHDLAARLGINRITLANIEREARNPSLDMAFRIAREVGQPVDELFNVDEADAGTYRERFRLRRRGRVRVEVAQSRDGYFWQIVAGGSPQIAGNVHRFKLGAEYEAGLLRDLVEDW